MEAVSELKAYDGVVTATRYASEGFSVGSFEPSDGGDGFTIVAKMLLRIGMFLSIKGEWTKHPQYGRQLTCKEVLPSSTVQDRARGLRILLERDPEFRNIGPVRSRVITARYGDKLEEALAHPEQMAAETGIPLVYILGLTEAWAKRKDDIELDILLAVFGLTDKQRKAAKALFGGNAAVRIRENPYCLMELTGFGFRRADAIALRNFKVPRNSPYRIDAALKGTIDEETWNEGNLWVETDQLVGKTLEMLDGLGDDDDSSPLFDRIDVLEQEGKLITFDDGNGVSTPFWLDAEQSVYGWIENRKKTPIGFTLDLESAQLRQLTEHQRPAVELLNRSGVLVISGPAGCGKTFIANRIAEEMEERGMTVTKLAPTGRAARHIHGETIHKALGYNGYSYERDCNFECDCMIVDETSMLGTDLAAALLRWVDPERTVLILVGDHHQLPAVAPGNVLRDLIEHDIAPACVLHKVMRHAGPLYQNARRVLKGIVSRETAEGWLVEDNWWDEDKLLKRLRRLITHDLSQAGYDFPKDVQVLTPTKLGKTGTRELNRVLQKMHQESLGRQVEETETEGREKFYPGDKVIHTKNLYDLDEAPGGLMNGTMGTYVGEGEHFGLIIDYEGYGVVNLPAAYRDHVMLGYSISIHRAQGSEFPCVVVIMHHTQPMVLHHRNLLYTAVTRAQRQVIVLGTGRALDRAAANTRPVMRKTFLPRIARGEFG